LATSEERFAAVQIEEPANAAVLAADARDRVEPDPRPAPFVA
jgi:hypothetical protein